MFEPLRSTTKSVVLRCLILSVPVCVNVFKTFFSTNHPVCRAISTTLQTVSMTLQIDSATFQRRFPPKYLTLK